MKAPILSSALLLFALSACSVKEKSAGPPTQDSAGGFQLVDKAGNIRRPSDFRTSYEALGTFTVLNPPGGMAPNPQGGNEMHVTYASRGTAEIYRKTGKFPDGAVLVKEVFGTEHAQMTTGDAHWASGTKVWFVMIKDEKARFSENPLWGDGWGWALFNADAPDKQVATNYRTDCLGCHIPARNTDWIYVQGYPVLTAK